MYYSLVVIKYLSLILFLRSGKWQIASDLTHYHDGIKTVTNVDYHRFNRDTYLYLLHN